MLNEWVNITTFDQARQYEVELDIYSDRVRYRKILHSGMCSNWIMGNPPATKPKGKACD